MLEEFKNRAFSIAYTTYKIMKQRTAPYFYVRLKHAKQLGFEPKVIFDCGAYIGTWTKRVSKLFPNAIFLLAEPNTEVLTRIKVNIKNISSECILLNVAVGEKTESAYLNIWENEPQGSSVLSHVSGPGTKKIPIQMQTLDEIALKHGLIPDLVKLDLQGGEIAALRGAKTLLGKTEMFIVEFGCLDAYIGRTTPKDLMDVMYANNYCLYDIVDFGYRPYDGALGWGDFFFIRRNSKLKEYAGYR